MQVHKLVRPGLLCLVYPKVLKKSLRSFLSNVIYNFSNIDMKIEYSMNFFFKVLKRLIIAIIILTFLCLLIFFIGANLSNRANLKLLGDTAPTLETNGQSYRDLNKNGTLDIYEDARENIENRTNDLIGQMTLEEKAGAMFISMIISSPDGSLSNIPSFSNPMSFLYESNVALVAKKRMNHFNNFQSLTKDALAQWNNNIQKLSERTRLGIPITIASDPRHSSSENPGASIPNKDFSHWCSPIGFAAIGDTLLVKEFGNIARQEYNAVGIRLALHPMADLATEPRWGRINGTFGENAELSAALTKAYILGFQGDTLTSSSVACMTKHFSGGGPQKDGDDPHFPYGKDQVYPGDNFNYHLIPFEKGAFPANTAQIMPYYAVPVGQTSEDVGFAFNQDIITGLLRKKYGFEGVICTDWGLISDNFLKPAANYGVEHLNRHEAVAKILNAGCDMLGGENSPQLVIDLVKEGIIDMERIDESIKRIMRDKFTLGLFDNPYVDLDGLDIVGNPTFIEKGKEAQRKSLVLLKNENSILPLDSSMKIYVEGIDKLSALESIQYVNNPKNADVIILRIATPYEPRSEYFIERFFHQGSLSFTPDQETKLLKIISIKPTITVVSMDRPAIIPNIYESSAAVIADFDVQHEILMELIMGKFSPTGKLPFEIPSSMEAVEKQMEDVPYDSENPQFEFGYGLTY